MLATRLRQLPLNPPLSYTLWKQRQPEDTIPEDSDPVPLGRDIIFTFTNLPDPGLFNLFTPKRKEQRPPVLQENSENSRDSDPPDNSNPDSSNFNNDDDDDDEVNNYLGDVDEKVPV